jgi:hypothetical protein
MQSIILYHEKVQSHLQYVSVEFIIDKNSNLQFHDAHSLVIVGVEILSIIIIMLVRLHHFCPSYLE